MTRAHRGKAAEYEAWYHTPRGRWIAGREHGLMMGLMGPAAGETLLDAGCGTGHFSARFARAGLTVTGLDPDPAMVAYARTHYGEVAYVQGTALALPFASGAFDWGAAVTSLCFMPRPAEALAELWRVTRRGVVLGLLNRRSLLHRAKAGKGGYAGARWDTLADVRRWAAMLDPPPRVTAGSAVFVPSGSLAARILERVVPARLRLGGFLAVSLVKRDPVDHRWH